MSEPWLDAPIVGEVGEEDQASSATPAPAEEPWLEAPEVFPNKEAPPAKEEATSLLDDVGTFIAELPQTVAGGVNAALNNIKQGIEALDEAYLRGLGKIGILDIDDETKLEPLLPDLPEFDPSTVGGRMTKGIAQFTTGFIPAFQAIKLPGALARAVSAGAVADFSVFDPQEGRLSDLIQEAPALRNPVTEYLATDKDDSELEGRIKNVLEGMAIGAVADSFVHGLRALKNIRKARATAAPGKAVDDLPASGGREPPGGGAAADATISEKPVDLSTAPPGLTPENLLTPLDPSFQTRAAGRTSLFPTREVRVAGNINLDRIDSPEAFKNAVDVIARSEGGFEGARAAGRDAGEVHTRAIRRLFHDSTLNLMAETKGVVGGSLKDKLRFQARLMQHKGIQEQMAGAAAEASARFRAFKEIMRFSPDDIKGMKEVAEQWGGEELIEQKAGLLETIKDLEAFNKAAEKIWKPTKLEKVLEFWRAGLLTGLRTQEVNFGTNNLVTAYTVPERLLGAAFGAMSGGKKIEFQEGLAFAHGAVKAWQKAAGDAWQVFWREGPEGFVPERIKGKIPGLKEGDLPTGPSKFDPFASKRAIEGELGYWVRSPFRLLSSMDMFSKTVNYAGEAEALALRQAMNGGHTGGALREETARILADIPDDIAEAANKRAATNTFTTPLHQQEGLISDVARTMSQFTAKHPAFGFVAPFIKTPANIFKFAGERSPAAFFMKDWKKAFALGGPSRQEALAKVTLGTAIMGTAAWYAAEGKLTGNGPIDPAERRIWRQAGFQPYSVLIGGTWYSYARFEPFGTLLGFSADMVEIGKNIRDEGEWDKLSMLVVMAGANTITSKTFMQGPNAMIEAVNDPRRFGDRFVQMLAGSFVPTIAADVARAVDPTLRDTRSVLDALLNRVVVASGLVEPLLNMRGEEIVREGGRLGQIFNPVYVSKAGKDKVSEEMLRIKYSPSMPQRRINGHDLSPKQYSQYVKLSGGAFEILDRLVGGAEWAGLPDFAKVDVMEQVIGEFRSMARGLMMAEHPELSIPKDIQEQFGIEAPSATPGDKETSALTPDQANLLASAAGVPSVDRPRTGGKAPAIADLEKRIDDAGAALAKASSIGVPDRPQVDGEKMLEIVSEPNRLLTALFEDSGSLPADEPRAFSAQVEMVQRATDYLTANIPVSPDPLGIFNEEPSIPGHERENWDRRVAAVTAPLSVVEDIGNGQIDDVALDALRVVHPAIFERLRASLVTALVDEKEPVAYERRMVMGELLGPGLEPTLNPRFIANMQNTFAAPPQAETAVPGRQQLSPSEERQKSKNISVSMAESLGGGESLSTPIQEVAES